MDQDKLINLACNLARADVRRNEIPHAIREAMYERCLEQGHQFNNGCTVYFAYIKICRWCGAES